MQRTLATALAAVAIGDIIHGSVTDGPSLLILVTDLTTPFIIGRRITTGQVMRFDRKTGVLQEARAGAIGSIEPLPPDIHDTLLHLDRVSRLSDPERTPERVRLTDVQLAALRFTHDFYPANPIVAPDPPND